MNRSKSKLLSSRSISNFLVFHPMQQSTKLMSLLKRLLKVMSSSRGRDKLCGLIQYVCRLLAVSALGRYKDLTEMPVRQSAYFLWQNLSNTRKVFRFLKFLEVFDDILALSSSTSAQRSFYFLEIIKLATSFFYFLLDNFIWLTRVNVFDSTRLSQFDKLVRFKRHLSFTRCALTLVQESQLYLRSQSEINRIVKNILIGQIGSSDSKSTVSRIVKLRYVQRKSLMSILHQVTKSIMLMYTIGILAPKYLSEVGFSILGLFSNLYSVHKYITGTDQFGLLHKINASYEYLGNPNYPDPFCRESIIENFSSVFS